MAHNVIVFPQARVDVRRNAEWLRRHFSARSADRWNDGIVAAIDSLANNPERCPEADEAADLGIDLRVSLSGRRPHVFRILFTFDAITVNVHRVRHAAQARLTEDNI